MNKLRKLKVFIENTSEESIIITTEYQNGELRVKFLEEFQDFVINTENKPHILAPGSRVEINYKKVYKE